jgi:hypothetical protein
MAMATTASRRLRFGRVRRLAASLAILAVFVQCVFASAGALHMWADTQDPLGIWRAVCIGESGGQAAPDGPDQVPVHPPHDHDHCLLCNAGLIAGTLPAAALLPVPFGILPLPLAAVQFATAGNSASPHQPRAPPPLA